MNSRNIARCALCGDIIESNYRHHFITCKCGEISLDGGSDYQRAVFGDRKNLLRLSEEEIAAWDLLPAGRLEGWLYRNGLIYAQIYDDKLKRFRDGTEIRTSTVESPAKDRKEGRVIRARNSTYLLGKKFVKRKDWVSSVEEEAADSGVAAV